LDLLKTLRLHLPLAVMLPVELLHDITELLGMRYGLLLLLLLLLLWLLLLLLLWLLLVCLWDKLLALRRPPLL
jgi:hypothetical protein